MINNDEQLTVVREQMATAEAALDALRRELRPQNAEMYGVMAESYIDMILTLRAEIDAYLEIAAIPETADLVISLKGRRVGLGQTSAGLVTRFIDTFRRGLQSAVEILESVNRKDTARRRERWIEKICDLPLVGVGPGSVKILLGEPESESLFTEDEKESLTNALDFIFMGLNWADTNNKISASEAFSQLSEETRQSLLALITRLLPPRSGRVESVEFQRRLPNVGRSRFITAVLTEKSRDRIRSEIARLASNTEFAELEGVIRSVDSVVIVSGSVETSRKTQKSKMSADNIEFRGSDESDYTSHSQE